MKTVSVPGKNVKTPLLALNGIIESLESSGIVLSDAGGASRHSGLSTLGSC